MNGIVLLNDFLLTFMYIYIFQTYFSNITCNESFLEMRQNIIILGLLK